MNIEPEELLIAFMKSFPSVRARGILLYGSTAEGRSSDESDYDLIVFGDAQHSAATVTTVEGITLDVLFYTFDSAVNELTPKHWRRNIVLYALQFGRILFDSNQNLLRLQRYARTLWNQGLVKPVYTNDEVINHCSKLISTVYATKEHAKAGRMNRRLAECRIDQLMIHLIEITSGVKALWSYPPWVTIRLHDPRYSMIQQHLIEYFSDISLEARSVLLSDIARSLP